MAKKLYHKIGEACKLLEIEPYVLRYWETEFPFLSPNKSKSGQRVYGEKELALIRRIKELLYDEGYTIAGAKRKLETELEEGGEPGSSRDGSKSNGGDGGSLDTASAEEVKNLREGLEGALRQAREILDLLGASAS